jgi:hypothetical protein
VPVSDISALIWSALCLLPVLVTRPLINAASNLHATLKRPELHHLP